MRSEQPQTDRSAQPTRTAAIIHTDLEPALVQTLVEAFQATGCDTRLFTPGDLFQFELAEPPEMFQSFVLDETIGGRPALEFLLNLRAHPEAREIPVCVLYDRDLPPVAWSAYCVAGTDRLVRKGDREEIARLGESMSGLPGQILFWHAHSNRARRVIVLAQEEARRLGASAVDTEHLLLGLLAASHEQPTIAGNILQRLGISLDSIREEILKQVKRGRRGQPDRLAPRARRAVELALEEAREMRERNLTTGIGTEHQLLGLMREGDGLAARVLAGLGADVEGIRLELEGGTGG